MPFPSCEPSVITPLFCVRKNFSRSTVLYRTPLTMQDAQVLTRRSGPHDSAHSPSLTDSRCSLCLFSICCNKSTQLTNYIWILMHLLNLETQCVLTYMAPKPLCKSLFNHFINIKRTLLHKIVPVQAAWQS